MKRLPLILRCHGRYVALAERWGRLAVQCRDRENREHCHFRAALYRARAARMERRHNQLVQSL